MPLELSYLSASVALFGIYLMGEVVTGNIQYNPKELLGARDTMPPNNMAVGRAKRATQNMLESMIMFVPLILIAHATDRFNDMTELGAGLFLGARILYAPCYWFGVPVLRSLAWFAGMIGIVMIFLQVLPFTGA